MAEIWGAAIAAGATLAGTAMSGGFGGGGGAQQTQSNEYPPGMLEALGRTSGGLASVGQAGVDLGSLTNEWQNMRTLSPSEQYFSDQGAGMAKATPWLSNEQYRANVLGAFNQQSGAAGQYLNQIAGPALSNQMTAAGLGRSGAQGEALAHAGMEMALPLAQQQAQFEINYPQMLSQLQDYNYGNLAKGSMFASMPFQRRAQALGQQQGLYALGQQGAGMGGPTGTTQTGPSQGMDTSSMMLPLMMLSKGIGGRSSTPDSANVPGFGMTQLGQSKNVNQGNPYIPLGYAAP